MFPQEAFREILLNDKDDLHFGQSDQDHDQNGYDVVMMQMET